MTAEDGRCPGARLLVYRKDRFVRGSNPLLIYGYGAYGLSES